MVNNIAASVHLAVNEFAQGREVIISRGQLVEIGVKGGRSTKPNLKIGICGAHGGDSDSVKFFHRTGLNYVSCSPFRIPVARLAAAQAVLEERGHARSEIS